MIFSIERVPTVWLIRAPTEAGIGETPLPVRILKDGMHEVGRANLFENYDHASLYTLPGAQKVRKKSNVSLIAKNDIFHRKGSYG